MANKILKKEISNEEVLVMSQTNSSAVNSKGVVNVEDFTNSPDNQKRAAIEVLSNTDLPEVNQNQLNKALKIVKTVRNRVKTEKSRVLELMDFKIYRGDFKGYKYGTILVEITFNKCQNNEMVVIPYKELKQKPKKWLDILADYVILPNISIDSIIECIEDTYLGTNTEYKGSVIKDKRKAIGYYNDLLAYVEDNPEEFINLGECKFDFDIHKGYFINNTIVVTNEFLADAIFVKENIYCEVVSLSSNDRGYMLNVLKKEGLLVTNYKCGRKDIKFNFTNDKTGKIPNAYMFKIDKSYLVKEAA